MVHKPKHRVHSFRGLLGSTPTSTVGNQEEINLERQNVNLAYRIVKLRLFPPTGDSNIEATVKVYREEQVVADIDNSIDFTDPDLLGAAMFTDTTSANYPAEFWVVFDNTIFSRNIFITNSDPVMTANVNYYIELEEVSVNAATLMQLKLGVARKLDLRE